ncbi:hypothetical protein Tco_0327290 [Tanacetum coccineum]
MTYPGNGYGVSTSCTVLGPHEGKSTNIGGGFTNLENLKCWSLETSNEGNYGVLDLYDVSKTLKNSRPLLDLEEYVVSTSVYTPYIILWSNIKKSTLSANTPYPRTPIHRTGGVQYAVPEEPNTPYPRSPIHRTGGARYAISRRSDTPHYKFKAFETHQDGPFRVLKKINDNAYKIELPGHYNVSITFNVADLSPYKEDSDDEPDSGSNLFQEGDDDADAVNELSKIMGKVLIPENEVKGVTTRRGKMTSEATPSKEINEPRINKNEPPKFEQEVQEKPHEVVYGKACHLPMEIEHKAHWALKRCNMDLMLARKSRLVHLNELAELRDDAYENTRIYKERAKKWNDSRLRGDKDIKASDKVLPYNSRLKIYPGKLKSKWSGPNIFKSVYPYGAIEIIDKNGFSFKVNGQRLKKYYEGNIDKEDDEVIEFEDGVTRG